MRTLIVTTVLSCSACSEAPHERDTRDAPEVVEVVDPGDVLSDTAADAAETQVPSEVADDVAEGEVTQCPAITPARMEAGEGELVRFTLTHAETITAGSLTTSREGDVLVVRAPWTSGAPTEYPIAASADGCPTALATLAVTPMRVSSLTWPAGEGPEEREHPIFWIDPAAPDTLVVGSGYGFVPRQFTPLWDLWTRDLADDAAPWVQLETSRSSKLQGGLGGRVVDGPPGGELSFYVQGGEGPADTFLLAHDDEGWDMVAGDAPDNQLHAFVQIAASDYLMALGLVPDGDSYSFERDVYHFGVDGWATAGNVYACKGRRIDFVGSTDKVDKRVAAVERPAGFEYEPVVATAASDLIQARGDGEGPAVAIGSNDQGHQIVGVDASLEAQFQDAGAGNPARPRHGT